MGERVVVNDPFRAGRQVDFYLRLHRHLPDKNCSERTPFTICHYRPDLVPINKANQRVVELQKDPEFRKKEQEVTDAVLEGKVYN